MIFIIVLPNSLSAPGHLSFPTFPGAIHKVSYQSSRSLFRKETVYIPSLLDERPDKELCTQLRR